MYREHTVSQVADIPPLIKAFATDLGWTTSGLCTLSRPGGGESFNVSAGTYVNPQNATPPLGVHKYIQVDHASVYRLTARSYLPRLNGTFAGGWEPGNPSRLHLMGGVERGSAYIVAVVECGFNLYRHIYIGNMVKHGNYAGGECVSLNTHNNFFRDDFIYPLNMMANNRTRFLFSSGDYDAMTYAGIDEFGVNDIFLRSGGVNVLHADNPNTWRRFSNIRDGNGLVAKEVGGGYKDGANDYAVAKGFCPFAGSAVLVTPNLWCSYSVQNQKANNRFVPIGHPAGARMVNMRDLAPGAEISVGAQTWRVFPEFSKRDTWLTTKSAGYAAFESTKYDGYAYLVA